MEIIVPEIDEIVNFYTPETLDLGYFNKEALFDISQSGGHFLCRLNHQVSLYKEVMGEE